jgi:hypothetical protein
VRAALEQWAPIELPDRAKTRLRLGLGTVLGLAMIAAWIASSWVSDPRAVAATVTVLYGGLGYLGWSGESPTQMLAAEYPQGFVVYFEDLTGLDLYERDEAGERHRRPDFAELFVAALPEPPGQAPSFKAF